MTVSAQYSEKFAILRAGEQFWIFQRSYFFVNSKIMIPSSLGGSESRFFLTSSFHDFFGFFCVYLFVAGEHSKFLSIQDHSHDHLKAL